MCFWVFFKKNKKRIKAKVQFVRLPKNRYMQTMKRTVL